MHFIAGILSFTPVLCHRSSSFWNSEIFRVYQWGPNFGSRKIVGCKLVKICVDILFKAVLNCVEYLSNTEYIQVLRFLACFCLLLMLGGWKIDGKNCMLRCKQIYLWLDIALGIHTIAASAMRHFGVESKKGSERGHIDFKRYFTDSSSIFSWKFFYSFGLNTHATSKFLMPINTLSTDLSDIVLGCSNALLRTSRYSLKKNDG